MIHEEPEPGTSPMVGWAATNALPEYVTTDAGGPEV
jgi:hypothetical protein